jgi:formate hydrogenlyase subunit 3/multisubunit Na+/H+ antiporter MnhD subunit
MKWVLLALSIYAFLVSANALLLMPPRVPGTTDWFNVVLSVVALAVAIVLGWLSHKRFDKDNRRKAAEGDSRPPL